MRKDIEGQFVHVEGINLAEIQLGDTVVFPTAGESKKDKKAYFIGWEHLADLPQEAAEVILMRQHPESIFNSKGKSANGAFAGKMDEWEIGFGVVIEMPLAVPYEERVVIACRTAKDKYELLRSRETRQTKRFS